jgi:nitrogen fixation protein FixH
MNWGKRIVLAYAVFMAIIITLVVLSFREDVNLVTSDYYQQEIAYQGRINQMNNLLALDEKPLIRYNPKDKKLTLVLPENSVGESFEGKIEFFRPSDGKLDFQIPLTAKDAAGINLDLSAARSGYWRMKIAWENAGVAYYHEEQIIL